MTLTQSISVEKILGAGWYHVMVPNVHIGRQKVILDGPDFRNLGRPKYLWTGKIKLQNLTKLKS